MIPREPPPPLFAQDDEPNERERCPHCGQRMPKDYPHRLDLAKIKLLRKIEAMNDAGVEWVKVQRDGGLIRDPTTEIQSDDVHAMRLRWFGMLKWKRIRTGEYQITEYGRRFLRNQDTAPERIWVRDGAVVSRDEGQVKIQDVQGVILDREYWDRYRGRDSESAE